APWPWPRRRIRGRSRELPKPAKLPATPGAEAHCAVLCVLCVLNQFDRDTSLEVFTQPLTRGVMIRWANRNKSLGNRQDPEFKGASSNRARYRPTCSPSTRAWCTSTEIGNRVRSFSSMNFPKAIFGTESSRPQFRACEKLVNEIHGKVLKWI